MERGLDQAAFGALIGKSQRTVSAVEGGAVTLPVLLTVMNKLGKSFADLEGAEKRLERPQTHSGAETGGIPLADHRAAIRALRLEIEALERQHHQDGGDLSEEQLRRLGAKARAEAATMPRETTPAGTGRTKHPTPGRTTRKR